jgi:hypothetical protein
LTGNVRYEIIILDMAYCLFPKISPGLDHQIFASILEYLLWGLGKIWYMIQSRYLQQALAYPHNSISLKAFSSCNDSPMRAVDLYKSTDYFRPSVDCEDDLIDERHQRVAGNSQPGDQAASTETLSKPGRWTHHISHAGHVSGLFRGQWSSEIHSCKYCFPICMLVVYFNAIPV